jgi:gamma-glutamyltranspeptidase / glutathione hydrolase
MGAIGLSRGRDAVVASGHAHATQAALAVLRTGGNAVDAAVAGALVLCVVCPYACTLAGDLYLLVYDPQRRAVWGLNGTGRAAQAATLARFAAGIPREGALSATVPGLPAGLADALAQFGTRSLAELIAPAQALAHEGFAINAYLARNINDRAELIARDAAASALFLPGGTPLAAGARLRQPDLAAILDLIADEGTESFYRGTVAERVLAAGKRVGWQIDREDLAGHRSLVQAPIAAPFHGREVWTMPPNSYGATLLLQLMLLEADGIQGVDPDGAEFVLRGIAARRAAYRAAGPLIGDPERLEAPLRALIETVRRNGGRIAEPAPAMPAEARDRCTTNIVVVDRAGLAVSLIASISAPFGAGVVLPGTGIVLNNRLAGFTNDPASANCVAPGKRPAHTLAPCIVTENGALSLTIGTPGTVGQTCTLAQVLARVLACGQDVAVAADRPRWSVDFAGKPVVEDTMNADLCATLRAELPELRTMPAGWISFGSIKLVQPNDGTLTGIADHRRCATTAAL